jgi:hypothetical protein
LPTQKVKNSLICFLPILVIDSIANKNKNKNQNKNKKIFSTDES